MLVLEYKSCLLPVGEKNNKEVKKNMKNKSLRKGVKIGATSMVLLVLVSISVSNVFAWGPMSHDAIAWSTADSGTIGSYSSYYYDVGTVSADIGDFPPLLGKDPSYDVAWRMHDRNLKGTWTTGSYQPFTINMYKLYATTDHQKAFTLGWRGHVRGADPVVLSGGVNDPWTKLMLDHISYYDKGGRAYYVYMYTTMVKSAYQKTYGVSLSTADIDLATATYVAGITTERAGITYPTYLYAKSVYGTNYNNILFPISVSNTKTQVKNLRLYGYSILSPNTELLQVNTNKPEKGQYEELEKQLGEGMENEIERVASKLLSDGIIEVPIEKNSQTGLTKFGPAIVKDKVKYDAEVKALQENLETIKERHPQYKKFKETGKVD